MLVGEGNEARREEEKQTDEEEKVMERTSRGWNRIMECDARNTNTHRFTNRNDMLRCFADRCIVFYAR